ncbi:MAG: N-acetyltransferase [Proteobacteria bacterium]|nr:N-acetyltransferase [Pseudomonadota bacterium]
MRIQPAKSADVPEIAAIYAHHVQHGTASYEIAAPTEAEMVVRLARVLDAGWPWLVARGDKGEREGEREGEMLGYAYASQFRDRAAYRFACENSVYVRSDLRGAGIGTALLAALLDAARLVGFRQMIAVIGGAEPASVALHAGLGFAHAGTLRAIGRKHGRWLDTVYMQIALGDGAAGAPAEEPQ